MILPGSSQRNRKRQNGDQGADRRLGLVNLEPKLPKDYSARSTARDELLTLEISGSALGTPLVTPHRQNRTVLFKVS